MNKYRIVYQCSNGYEGEEFVYAKNRIMAFEVFKDLGYEDIVNADCFRVIEEESK
jgi:hypothetical protein